jgi:DNA polymerase
VKCRPPKNRKPKQNEISTCSCFLQKQINIINPRIICTLGAVPLESLIGKMKLSIVHGKALNHQNRTYIPLYHPASALYNRKLSEKLIDDMKKLGTFINEYKNN